MAPSRDAAQADGQGGFRVVSAAAASLVVVLVGVAVALLVVLR